MLDLSPYPDQDADQLRSRIRAAETELRAAGFDVAVCVVPDDLDVAGKRVGECLADRSFDVVEIGSGLRTSHEYTLIFERVVNAVVAHDPGVRLCFNDSPETTLDAVRRAVTR